MAFPIVKMGNKPPTSPLPLARRWPPSNIAMLRPTARTTPNGSSDGWGTVAHVRRKVPIGYNGAPQIRPKSTHSRGPIPKPHYLPHPWTRPTYEDKRYPDPICRFSAMHWTDRRTDAPTDRSSAGKFDDYDATPLTRATRRNNKSSNNKQNRTPLHCSKPSMVGLHIFWPWLVWTWP